MDLKDIKAIIDLMKKNSISEFEMERQDFKIRLKRGLNGGANQVADEAPAVSYAAPIPQVPSLAVASGQPAGGNSGDREIKSPMVGTFYRAPSPESAAYIEVGNEVGPDTVVALIEAMKVMNEIKADVRGIITQVLAENAKPVEFGQPLFKIRPL